MSEFSLKNMEKYYTAFIHRIQLQGKFVYIIFIEKFVVVVPQFYVTLEFLNSIRQNAREWKSALWSYVGIMLSAQTFLSLTTYEAPKFISG